MNFSGKLEQIKNKNIFSNIKLRKDFPLLINHMGYKKICEVGVNRGEFLTVLGTSNIDHLVGVDVWDKRDIEAYKNIIDFYVLYPHDDNKIWREEVQKWAKQQSYKVDIIVDYSIEAVKMFEDNYFDLVYIDADHTYEGVFEDLEAWYSKVREGGAIAGHDYINAVYDNGTYYTKDAIDDFVLKYNKSDFFFITKDYGYSCPSFLIIK